MIEPFASEAELLAIAERALDLVAGDAQVTVQRERRLSASADDGRVADTIRVEFACVADGAVGVAATAGTGDEALLAAVAQARRATASATGVPGYPGLPEPAPARPHDGWDPGVLTADPRAARERLLAAAGPSEATVRWSAAAARTAIASTRGVRATEQRSHARADLAVAAAGGRRIELAVISPRAAGLELAGPLAGLRALAGVEEPVPAPAGEHAVVLGPHAVAALLHALRGAFSGAAIAAGNGPLAGRLGTRVVASCVALAESPRFPAGLPRSYDAEGVPRRPLPLIQDGVAHRAVHDTASASRAGGGAASTGNARAVGGGAPVPEHMILIGGGAAGTDELAEPLERGLLLPLLAFGNVSQGGRMSGRATGAWLIEGGRPTTPVQDPVVECEPLAVLAATEALSADQVPVPGPQAASAAVASAKVCPALRAAGMRVVPE